MHGSLTLNIKVNFAIVGRTESQLPVSVTVRQSRAYPQCMHYHQNPYVRNVTGLHRNYEHKRQIKAIKDCFITWKMI